MHIILIIGFGRTSYRLAEIIQIGRIPAYLYDDIPWIPYEGTNASIETFGFIGQRGSIQGTNDSIDLETANGTS
jgi:hypothetical protein